MAFGFKEIYDGAKKVGKGVKKTVEVANNAYEFAEKRAKFAKKVGENPNILLSPGATLKGILKGIEKKKNDKEKE